PAAAPLHQNAGVLIAAAPAPGKVEAPTARPNAFAHRPVAAPKPAPVPVEPTRLDGAHVHGDELVIDTHGGTPSFTVLGGNAHLLLLSVENMPLTGQGKLMPIGVNGIKQVRAALYDNRGPVTHLAIDTDGSVRLTPMVDAAGNIRLRITGPNVNANASSQADVATSAVTATTELHAPKPVAKPAAKPIAKPAAKPQAKAKPAPKPRLVRKPQAPKPMAVAPKPTGLAAPTPLGAPAGLNKGQQAAHPTATPTPMAVPHGGAPAAATPRQAASGRAKVSFDSRHLEQTPTASYRFPLERDKATGRVNPFKPIPNPMSSPLGLPGGGSDGPSVNGKPAPLPQVPAAPGGAPGTANKPGEAGYKLQAVMIGGGSPPQALVSVGGHTLVVGLNQSLPGNVKVKSIQTDYVILSADGRTIRLNLKR
ncbi:MAG: hypothetical protein JWM80_1, partial [Cyanobacteria bacterium RYN_339]|nr:hypothetical protein [Cyanobacteria bacterium RYN_339]